MLALKNERPAVALALGPVAAIPFLAAKWEIAVARGRIMAGAAVVAGAMGFQLPVLFPW